MTEVQNFMLVVCFGCTIGFLIGTFSIMVSDGDSLSEKENAYEERAERTE